MWEECIKSGAAVKITLNKSKAISLINTAKGRIDYTNSHRISETTANYIFENYYTCLVEYLHALVLLEGYKVTNHVCLGYFLKCLLKKEQLFRIFDDCRYKRNALLYYGKQMDFAIAKKAINSTKIIIYDLQKIILEKLN